MKVETIQKYQNKSLSKLKDRARHWFNMFIRLRDCDDNGFARCISSNVPMQYGTSNYQAGHYYSAGHYPVMAFNENNVHAQSKSDNYFKSGNLIEYRKNLIRKIGLERVIELDLIIEQSKRRGFKHDRIFLIETIEKYKAKCKELLKGKAF